MTAQQCKGDVDLDYGELGKGEMLSLFIYKHGRQS